MIVVLAAALILPNSSAAVVISASGPAVTFLGRAVPAGDGCNTCYVNADGDITTCTVVYCKKALEKSK
jgi:hypothetical protein